MAILKEEHIKQLNLCNSCLHKHVCRRNLLNGQYSRDMGVFECDHYIDEDRIVTIFKPKIKKVIFNDPATIVIWDTGEKTIVKCQEGDIFDPEKGLAMAITKHSLGNKGSYIYEINRWVAGYYENVEENIIQFGIPTIASKILEGFAARLAELKSNTADPNEVEKMFKGE